MSSRISIIIPTYNEEVCLQRTIDSTRCGENIEVIVVDGGSTDKTLQIAQQNPQIRLVRAPAGRATQQNRGAAVAQGEILLFLHADSQLPQGYDLAIRALLEQKETILGAFSFKTDYQTPVMQQIEAIVNLRSRWFQLPYGDQGLFLKKECFQRLGGFPDLPIMEDWVLVKKAAKLGVIKTVPLELLTSGRRWRELGVFRTTLLNQWMVLGFTLGISPNKLNRWYRARVQRYQKSNI